MPKRSSNTDGASMSKTAKASLAQKNKKEGYKADADIPIIVPLNNGQHAYLRNPVDGKLLHLQVNSVAWNNLIIELNDTSHGPRIRGEINRLGWIDPVEARDAFMAEVEANDAALLAAIDATEV